MFELPEMVTLARQMNETLRGKTVQTGSLGNSPHKFVWYNRAPEEFASLVPGKRVGEAAALGRWLTLRLEPGYTLVLGECGGKVLYHAPGGKLPAKYHLSLKFNDGSALTSMTQMWGAVELFETGKELERQYIKDMRPTPVDPAFTFEYFDGLINSQLAGEKRSVKGLLTQEQLIPGLGNSIAQDILFRAPLHPRRALLDLSPAERRALFDSITATVARVTECGGRADETDLYGKPGGYQRLMDRRAPGKPCPNCAGPVQAIQYLGGACYFCPSCQK